MKSKLAALLLVGGILGTSVSSTVVAQEVNVISKDSFFYKFSNNSDTINVNTNTSKFVSGLTFTRLDLGFSKLVDNGSFQLSPTNDFLAYEPAKTSTVSFDIVQLGYRVSPNFKVYVAGGFDWTLIRLEKPITIKKNTNDLAYVTETTKFSKNRFSSSYLHIPLNFEFRTNEDAKGNRFYTIFGPEVAFLMSGKVKQVSDEYGKVKLKDDYNFQPFRYGATVRLGYGSVGAFAKYYFNDLFTSTQQEGLRNMSFGLTFGLN